MRSEVQAILDEFKLEPEKLEVLTETFIKQAQKGLDQWSDRGIPMIPTYVTKIPAGTETGVYLAADLGGSNFRVCSVELLGNHKYEIVQMKWPVAHELQISTSEIFFNFLAERVKEFICTHHRDHFEKDGNQLRMGFTFSFPIRQSSINEGTLVRWTKGFDIKDAVGKDVGQLFQAAMDKLDLKIHIAALVNDTVGSLMARAYTNEQSSATVIGCIFGTGTNGAYFDHVDRIAKYSGPASKFMAVNTEWGSFDNDLTVLPNTRYDIAVDKLTANPGYHMFEKRVSGMFLGELLRQVLCELSQKGLVFSGFKSNALTTPWSIDTSVPSLIEADTSEKLDSVKTILKKAFGVDPTFDDCKIALELSRAIGTRAAYLAATVIVGVLKHTEALKQLKSVDIGGDGSVFEFYPHFEERIREAIKVLIGDDERRITFGLAKDGSGVGAALCALEESI